MENHSNNRPQDPIMAVRDEEELKDYLEREKDDEEYRRLLKNPSPMARVILFHKYGEGDCPCNVCSSE